MSDLPTLSGPNLVLRKAMLEDAGQTLVVGKHPLMARVFGKKSAHKCGVEISLKLEQLAKLASEPHTWLIESNGLLGEIYLANVDLTAGQARVILNSWSEAMFDLLYQEEAYHLVLDYAFATLGLHQVSLHLPHAEPMEMYRKCGFTAVNNAEEISDQAEGERILTLTATHYRKPSWLGS